MVAPGAGSGAPPRQEFRSTEIEVTGAARIATSSPTAAIGQRAQHIRQACVGAEPLDQSSAWVLTRPTANV